MTTLFIRNPKTAGSSIVTRLKDHGAWEAGYGKSFRLADVKKRLGNEHCIILPGGMRHHITKRLGLEALAACWVVSAMRNPYARVISGWAHCIKKGWLAASSTPREAMKITAARHPHIWHHVGRQQWRSMCQGPGKPIVDQVLVFEWLQHDFDLLCDHLGYERSTLPTLNQSEHKPWRSYYTDDPGLRKLVENKMREDFKLLPYRWDLDGPTGRIRGANTPCPKDCT